MSEDSILLFVLKVIHGDHKKDKYKNYVAYFYMYYVYLFKLSQATQAIHLTELYDSLCVYVRVFVSLGNFEFSIKIVQPFQTVNSIGSLVQPMQVFLEKQN